MANFLFVHGGMLGGWCWKKVRRCLEDKNHLVLTPTLTGLGERKHLNSPLVDLEVHITDILNVIFYEDWTDIHLVGHSYGGMVIMGVADRIPDKIKRLVFVDALMPINGESVSSIAYPKMVEVLKSRAHEHGEGWKVPPVPLKNIEGWDPVDIEWFEARCTPHPVKGLGEPIHLHKGNLDHIDKLYVKCTQDHSLDAMAQRAKETGVPLLNLDTGHYPMVTEPEKLVELLLDGPEWT